MLDVAVVQAVNAAQERAKTSSLVITASLLKDFDSRGTSQDFAAVS